MFQVCELSIDFFFLRHLFPLKPLNKIYQICIMFNIHTVEKKDIYIYIM